MAKTAAKTKKSIKKSIQSAPDAASHAKATGKKQASPNQKQSKAKSAADSEVPTLGEYAYQILDKQFGRVVKQEKAVLQDQDPEHLHQMRVGTRRLRTALQIFDGVMDLPKGAKERRVRELAKVLGQLRDLDVQLEALQTQYLPQLPESEQTELQAAIERLHQQRHTVFAEVKSFFERSNYRKLKTAYREWLKDPKFNPQAELPLTAVLPDLLSPLLSHLLLHPGWFVSAQDTAPEQRVLLHELRKTCKHARYQAEFFTDFYDRQFHDWIEEIKTLQDNLGKLQDVHVLQELLSDHLPDAKLPSLQQAMTQEQEAALANWDTVRQTYLNPEFRQTLYQMILHPTGAPA